MDSEMDPPKPLQLPLELQVPGPSDTGKEKYLNFKLRHILCCDVCRELNGSPTFQCKFGHLLCAGCVCDIFAESKMQNEIPACPTCQTSLSKDTFFRNIAVEKAIAELPKSCNYCYLDILPQNFQQHILMRCEERPSICCNHSIGCFWKGPYSKKSKHEEECKQISASGLDILQSLLIMDEEEKQDTSLNEQIFELLSVEKFLHFDLQFKRNAVTPTPQDDFEEVFDTPKFLAYENHWLIHGYTKKKDFYFQLQLKSNLPRNKSLNMYYLIVKGPYSEMDVKPKLCQFKFDEKSTESPFETLSLLYETDSIKKYFFTTRVNFRLFFFLAK